MKAAKLQFEVTLEEAEIIKRLREEPDLLEYLGDREVKYWNCDDCGGIVEIEHYTSERSGHPDTWGDDDRAFCTHCGGEL